MCMMSFFISCREIGVCLIVQPPIGQFCLPWWVTWPLFILNDLISLIRSYDLIHLQCSFNSNVFIRWFYFISLFFFYFFFFFADKIIDSKLFLFKYIGYLCPIFHKIGNARGWILSRLGVLRVSTLREKTLRLDNYGKNVECLCLYSLAPPKLIASIQNI